MKAKWFLTPVLFIGLVLALAGSTGAGQALGSGPQGSVAPQAALGTAFTYQGSLTDGGSPANGQYDFEFKLYDDPTAGSQVGSTVTVDDKQVDNGLFTVKLDFGSSAFTGDARWLEIGVRPGDETGAYTTLSPRQELTPAPYSLNADLLDGQHASAFWNIGGNSGTTSSNFLGTTDNQALELRVNSARALRLEPNATSPNLIGGHSGNNVTAGVAGTAIGGGGYSGNTNRVTDNYSTVGGGANNQAGDGDDPTTNADYTTVGGGSGNTASGKYATVSGGAANTASFWYATVGGGHDNTASNNDTTVGGGYGNTASLTGATVGGGSGNIASGEYATVGGGLYNTAIWYDTVGGGTNNESSGGYATVGGGTNNESSGGYATVSGGAANTASFWYATVGGGYDNTASNYYATVGGGSGNTASGGYATVGGGWSNTANGFNSTIGGGGDNTASGTSATVAGGHTNTASGDGAALGGGYHNTASGIYATVPGGYQNIAQGGFSFAAGRRAKAYNPGCFVWGDSTDADVACDINNAFIVRASGGITMYTNSGLTSGVSVPAGGNAWSSVSDRNLKENFALIDGQEVLALLAELPLTTWNYKSQDDSIRHMGPMAQDFYAAFGLGEDERRISTVDTDGVALAAIQGLYQVMQEQETEIAALQQQNADLEARVAALEAKSAGPLQSGLLPGVGPSAVLGTGVLLVGLGLACVVRQGSILKPLRGGER